jgi:hypothetical protein
MVVPGASQPIHLSQWDRLKDLLYTSSRQVWWQETRKFMLLEDGCVRQPPRQLRMV